jgi:geranylgeranyl reductase family protein
MGVQRPQVLTTIDRDVVVVGGGPAGLIAARDLARGGLRVSVLEEHDRIGSPVHCTGVLGLDAFDELALPRASILATTHSARFVAPDGSDSVVATDRVRASVIDRVVFDRELANAALDAGATIHTGVRVTSLENQPASVTIRTTRSAIRARAAVIACGASYGFNRALGLGMPSVLVHSAQLEVPFPAVEHVEVHFGRHVAPGGFAWVVPFRRGTATLARVGLICDSGAAARFRAFAGTLRAARNLADDWGAPRLKVLPLAPIARTWTGRVLVVGDAAGLVKPTTGGGIYYGLLTGRIAAEVLTENLRREVFAAVRLKEYERRWRARLGPEIRAGLAFRAVASRLSDRAIDRLMELTRVDGIVPLLKQTADFNWHRSAALSLLRHASFRQIVQTLVASR